MSKEITTRAQDYAQWYNDLVIKGELADYSAVRGCMVIKPYGYALWENMRDALDKMFKDTGHVNAYFPLFIPKSFLSREAAHVEGFAKECAVVTHYRLKMDENGDGLLYKLEIRGVSETTWKVLKDKIQDRFLTFDSTAFPDGEYLLKVTATDAPDNPPGQALSTSATTSEFLIDNSPPVIEGLSAQPAGGRVQLRFRATDALNWISKAEYSMNGVEWLVIEPATKLSDSRDLAYDLLLDRPSPGELTIAVRVTDEFDNQAVGKVVVK